MHKIATIQLCSSTDVDANLLQIKQLIHEAAMQGAKLIVLPEMFARIMPNRGVPVLSIKEKFGQGKIQQFLSEQAKNNGVWIVGGTLSLEGDDESKETSSLLVFDAEGVCVARYNKIHLFDVELSQTEYYKESDIIEPGNQVVTVPTPFGVLGLAICYDIRFPELFRCLLNKGAEIIVLPAAFTVPTGIAHWEPLLRARAIENFCYVIAACQGGLHASGRQTYGHSMVVAPWGDIIAEKTDKLPGILYAAIDLNKVYEARKAIPIIAHQRKMSSS